MPAWLGPAISAIGNIAGGLIGGSGKGDLHDQWRHEKNMIDYQRGIQIEFARNGIKWKAADAKEAGIHPLYALGAPTTSFSPVSVGGSSLSGGSNLGGAIAAAGSDLGRAVSATSSSAERAYQAKTAELGLRRMQLENELLESQIAGSRVATMRQAGNGPAMPSPVQRWLIDGQGQAAGGHPLVSDAPLARTGVDPSRPFSEAGAIPDLGYTRTSRGYAPVPSSDAQQRMEDNFIANTTWAIRNQLLPSLGLNRNPPPIEPKKGYSWSYDPLAQEYVQEPNNPLYPWNW